MKLLITRDDLRGAPNAGELVGAEHGGLPVSLILVEHDPGAGPRLHRHPYPEVFVVHEWIEPSANGGLSTGGSI